MDIAKIEPVKLLVGSKIYGVRMSKGISQQYLADKLGLSQSWVSNVETGELPVEFDRLCEIAEILEVNVNAIINHDGSVVFNSCSQSGQHNNYTYNGVVEVKEIYEKLILEKDELIQEKERTIKLLEKMLRVE